MSFSLPSFLNDDFLNSLRTQMGARLSDNFKAEEPVRVIELPEVRRQLLGDGVDVDPNEVTVLPDGTFAYRNLRVLVYIRDVASYGDRQSQPRYHLYNCATLEKMRAANRWRRYVVANRDDGLFQVNIIDGNVPKAKSLRLDVCQNCLAALAWNGFSFALAPADRSRRVSGFALPEFFQRFPRDLHLTTPDQSSDTADINTYPHNWHEISEERKRLSGYRCAECSLQLTLRQSRFLHVHHLNGQKHDCSADNLQVLCVRCHANEPLHGHLKGSPDYREFVALFGN
jgi:hypothetical protein